MLEFLDSLREEVWADISIESAKEPCRGSDWIAHSLRFTKINKEYLYRRKVLSTDKQKTSAETDMVKMI